MSQYPKPKLFKPTIKDLKQAAKRLAEEYLKSNNLQMEKYTEETLMVRPFNKENFKKYLLKYFELGNNQDFIIPDDAIIFNENAKIILDTDCCHSFLEKGFNKESAEIEYCFGFGVRFKTEKEGSTNYQMVSSAIIEIFQSEWEEFNLLDPEISLKEFMGSRYKYNPRIESNTALLLKNANQN